MGRMAKGGRELLLGLQEFQPFRKSRTSLFSFSFHRRDLFDNFHSRLILKEIDEVPHGLDFSIQGIVLSVVHRASRTVSDIGR
jgi:hypothetical protein